MGPVILISHPSRARQRCLLQTLMLCTLAGLSACDGDSVPQADADPAQVPQTNADSPDAAASGSAASPAAAKQTTDQTQQDVAVAQRQSGQPPPYLGDLPSLAAVNQRDAQLDVVVEGLQRPWAFEFLNDDEILINEFPGSMQRLRLSDGQLTEVNGLPEIANDTEQSGLLDLALHPDYLRNQRIYFSYVITDAATGQYRKTVVDTAILEHDKLTDLQRILDGDPWGWSPSNFGGALAFDDQGYLFITIGDRSDAHIAQMGDKLPGKLLRLHDDGSIPADNPFVADPAVDDRIYALGLRNAQGLHFDPPSGLLLTAEHGPMGGDEVNVIRPGGNYGWPLITYGKSYTTASISADTHRDGLLQPLFYYLPSEAISPLTVYRGAMFPEWDGDVLVGALKGKHVSKLDLDLRSSTDPQAGVVRSEYPILTELKERVRDIKVDAAGAVYILTQPGKLYRLWQPATSTAAVKKDIPGAAIYGVVCAGCHDTGANAAPMLSQPQQWQTILQQSVSVTHAHVINGYRDMPERGLCFQCSDDELIATTEFMLEQVRQAAGNADDSRQ